MPRQGQDKEKEKKDKEEAIEFSHFNLIKRHIIAVGGMQCRLLNKFEYRSSHFERDFKQN